MSANRQLSCKSSILFPVVQVNCASFRSICSRRVKKLYYTKRIICDPSIWSGGEEEGNTTRLRISILVYRLN